MANRPSATIFFIGTYSAKAASPEITLNENPRCFLEPKLLRQRDRKTTGACQNGHAHTCPRSVSGQLPAATSQRGGVEILIPRCRLSEIEAGRLFVRQQLLVVTTGAQVVECLQRGPLSRHLVVVLDVRQADTPHVA